MGRFTLGDLGQTISLRGAREYLFRRGWRVLEEDVRLVCEGPPDDDGRPIVHFLPADESYADYALRLEDLISTLSVLEERPAVEIAAEMAHCDEPPLPPTHSLADDLVVELSGSGIQLAPGKDLQQAIDELRNFVTNAQLAIQKTPADEWNAWAEVALLAERFVRLVTLNRASSMLLWRLCDRVLGEAGLRLPSSPELVEELCKRASEAGPENLDDVLVWMRGRTNPIGTATEGKKTRPADAKHAGPPSDSGRSSQ